MEIGSIALLIVLGAAVGFVAGLLGIGGGMLMVPFMTMLLTAQGFPSDAIIKVAIATSLTTILFTSLSSVRAHHLRGAVLWPVVASLAPGILFGSLIGAQIAAYMPNRLLAVLFAVFIGFSAVQMLLNRKPKATRQLPGSVGMFGAGSGIGALAALVGAGGGFVSVPFMAWCNVPIRTAVATSAALGFPIALAGSIGYAIAGWNVPLPSWTLGYIYLPALVCIAIASVLTAPAGARTAHALPTDKLRRIFALVLFSLAAYMMWKAFH